MARCIRIREIFTIKNNAPHYKATCDPVRCAVNYLLDRMAQHDEEGTNRGKRILHLLLRAPQFHPTPHRNTVTYGIHLAVAVLSVDLLNHILKTIPSYRVDGQLSIVIQRVDEERLNMMGMLLQKDFCQMVELYRKDNQKLQWVTESSTWKFLPEIVSAFASESARAKLGLQSWVAETVVECLLAAGEKPDRKMVAKAAGAKIWGVCILLSRGLQEMGSAEGFVRRSVYGYSAEFEFSFTR
ncbi:hypothetical protein HDV00_006970 [Rhizophlyctis rosea]|nr:hypothetical protein HDV00_006970 [Rhizophlyctis rosea]